MKIKLVIFLFFSIQSINAQIFVDRKLTDTISIPIGKINGNKIVYDCHDCHGNYSGGLTVYSIKNNKRSRLLDLNIFDFYIDGVSLIKIKENDFIYISSNHTSGDSQGYLFFLNSITMKAYEVKIKSPNFKLPDSLQIRKYFDVTKDDKNNFRFGALLWTKSGLQADYSGYYKLKKIKLNQYVLEGRSEGVGIEGQY